MNRLGLSRSERTARSISKPISRDPAIKASSCDQYRTANFSSAETSEQQKRWHGSNLKISESIPTTPPSSRCCWMICIDPVVNQAWSLHYWQTTTSAIVRFIAAVPSALVLLNQWREHHGRRPLKASQ